MKPLLPTGLLQCATPRLRALSSLHLRSSANAAQGTLFASQVFLADSDVPANGLCYLGFRVFNALTSGKHRGATATVNDLSATNGRLTAALVPGATGHPQPARVRWVARHSNVESLARVRWVARHSNVESLAWARWVARHSNVESLAWEVIASTLECRATLGARLRPLVPATGMVPGSLPGTRRFYRISLQKGKP